MIPRPRLKAATRLAARQHEHIGPLGQARHEHYPARPYFQLRQQNLQTLQIQYFLSDCIRIGNKILLVIGLQAGN